MKRQVTNQIKIFVEYMSGNFIKNIKRLLKIQKQLSLKWTKSHLRSHGNLHVNVNATLQDQSK